MRFSTAKATAGQAWGVPLPALRDVHGNPLRITFARPSWHSMIFYLGLLGLSRSVLTEANLHDGAVSTAVYLISLPIALMVGQLVEKVKGPQVARILSATLGTVGILVASLAGDVPTLVAIAVIGMYVLHVTGELMCLLCPQSTAAEPTRNPARAAARPKRT
jgi:hypothetical protein